MKNLIPFCSALMLFFGSITHAQQGTINSSDDVSNTINVISTQKVGKCVSIERATKKARNQKDLEKALAKYDSRLVSECMDKISRRSGGNNQLIEAYQNQPSQSRR